MNDRLSRPFQYAASRAASRPAFWAFALRAYKDARGVTDESLAEELGVEINAVDKLALCFRSSSDIEESSRILAAALRIEPFRLVNLLKVSEALLALRARGASAASPGLLLAARDREEPLNSSEPESP